MLYSISSYNLYNVCDVERYYIKQLEYSLRLSDTKDFVLDNTIYFRHYIKQLEYSLRSSDTKDFVLDNTI